MHKKNTYFDDDIQLMLKVAEGDKNAFNKIYKKYFQIVIDYATSINKSSNLSEDIANEAFERVWRQRAKYKPTSTVKTYLFTFAGKVIQEYHRRSKYQRMMLNNYSDIAIIQEFNPEVIVQNMELKENIETAKNKLSKKQRQAIEFIFYHNMNINEAAKLAGCSNNVFSQRINDAKRQISVFLKQFNNS
ncbi:MAG: hypothetical protein A2Y12_00555 [Planctomycetes bacterium GWF2_42_9]|nr:MAG: hypothetical protein A2Y12_00555 [Planctomycetes bacterium GWF2_42_9]